MTRKDYLKAVVVVKEYESSGNFSRKSDKKLVVNVLADIFQEDNPRFQRDRFVKACDE